MALEKEAVVEYRQLGNSGLRVSVPILGTMGIGRSGWLPWVLDEEEALPLLKAAYDKGINTWDTANVYSNGHSERIIAAAIRKYAIPRHKLVLLTKCYGLVHEDPDARGGTLVPASAPKNMGNTYGLSRGALHHAVDASLARLQTPYIDVLQIHRFDPRTPIAETMAALHDLVVSGKVRYLGACSMWAHQFAQMQAVAERQGWTRFVAMQNCYNLLYREEEREMNPFCDGVGVGRIAYAPLARGLLARPLSANPTVRSAANAAELTAEDREIIARVETLARAKGWPMSHVALAWVGQKATSPIVGINSLARLEEIVGAAGKTLEVEEVRFLEEVYRPREVRGHV